MISIRISPTEEFKNLKDALEFLEKNTPLKYTMISENQVTVSPKKNETVICGYLIDYDTQEVIENASVRAGNNYTVTDDSGYFELESISRSILVRFSHIGYKAVNYEVPFLTETDCKTIMLIPRVEQIREVSIRNYLTKGIRKTIDGNFNFNFKNFGILPGLIEPDVLQTIQAIPGVHSVDESVSNINIRSGAHYENLILWDGIKMYQSGHFFGLISAFNPQLTKKVDLIKNGTPAHLGEGVSGTIAMYTDDVIPGKVSTRVGLNLINTDLLVKFPITDRGSLQVATRKSVSEYIQTPSYKQYFNKAFQNTELVNSGDEIINSNDEFSFFDVNVTGVYQLNEDHRIKANFLIFDNNLSFLESALINDELTSRESNLSQNNLAGGLNYSGVMNDEFSVDFQAYITKYNLEALNADILNEQRLLQENKVLEGSLKLLARYKLSRNFNWQNGYQFSETGITNIQDVDNPLYRSNVKEVVRIHAASTEFGFQSEDKRTSFRTGLRFSYFEKFGKFLLEPRLSFNRELLNKVNFELQGEKKHQYTTQIIDFQDDFLGIENRRWQLVNNDNIPIIESTQISAGLHYNSKSLLLSLTGYYKEVLGISSQSQGFQNQFRFEKSAGNYTVFGTDVLINYRSPHVSTWLSYGYMKNEYLFESLYDTKFPGNFDLTHAITLASTYTSRRLKISAGMNWHTGKPTTKPVPGLVNSTDQISYEAPNSSRLKDFSRVDVSMQYVLMLQDKTNINVGISVWNLLDTHNNINSYYRLVGNEIKQIDQHSLGITPNISVHVGF